MTNKIIQNGFFMLSALMLSSSLYAANTVNDSCEKYMREVILLSERFKADSTIKSKLNKMVKGDKLNQYLQNQWLSYIRNNKGITPNALYVDEKKLVKECVQFVKG